MTLQLIDNELVDHYCNFSGDYNPCHINNLLSKNKKRIIHGALICDSSLRNNINLKIKNIKRLKITFNNLLNVPASIETKILKEEEKRIKFSVDSEDINIINYETYFSEEKFPYFINTSEFIKKDKISIPDEWQFNFKKIRVYSIGENIIKNNFYQDSILDSRYSFSLGILSQIVGMYIPGKFSTSALYDIYYSERNDPNIYLKIVNFVPSISLLRILIQTKYFQAIINAKNKSPI